jgi:DNA-binding NtrC family response regulator
MNETTVLLVDDEQDFVEALAERLRLRGLVVEAAGSGALAIEKSGKRRFDAVLLDMAMPGLDGVQTLSRLLADNADLQVILLTGKATLAQAVAAMKLGALDLLEKPAPLETIVARIEEAATRRAARDDERIARRMRDITREKGW